MWLSLIPNSHIIDDPPSTKTTLIFITGDEVGSLPNTSRTPTHLLTLMYLLLTHAVQ